MYNNLMISASAGAGKTYQLSNRYIDLLAQGASPETIVALTFSRKAAGEIIDRIIRRLAEAASDSKALSLLNSGISNPRTSEQCLQHLRDLCMRMPLLQIGTIDSFMAHIVRLFPFELGIQGGFEVLEGASLEKAQQKALKEVLVRANNPDRLAFCEYFLRCMFGSSERSVTKQINQFAQDHHEQLLIAPDSTQWGRADIIWPKGQTWLQYALVDQDVLQSAHAQARLFADSQPKAFCNGFLKDIEALTDYSGITALKLNKIGKLLLERFNELQQPSFELIYKRKAYSFDEETCHAVHTIILHALQTGLLTHIERTRGLYEVLSAYEQAYERQIRSTGQLGFRDLLQVLTRSKAPTLSLEENKQLLYICYRLDGRYLHWMFDEFQDTSNQQWAVFSNLIDEVVQTAEADRTFFYVGDVKQAIYGWRGGDSRLFNRIYEKYRALPEPATLHKESLSCSWRSAPAVIETVNAIFSQLPDERIPQATVQRWSTNWQMHRCGGTNRELPGFCALYEVPASQQEENACFTKTVELIHSLQEDSSSSLSVAVLVRTKATGIALVHALREANIPTVWEGEMHLADNTVVTAFLSLFKLMDHPGDTFAWEHINMTPLRTCLGLRSISNPGQLASLLRRDVYRYGFEYALRRWLAFCEECGHRFSAFTTLRLRQFRQYALEFDRTDSPDALEFISYIEQQTTSEAPSSGSVSVLTIHKSKGLEYDAVILPELREHQSIDMIGSVDLSIHYTQDEEGFPHPEWVLRIPCKEISERDEVLRVHRQQLTEDSAYETLCTLYVAITRARHAAYMITQTSSRNRKGYYSGDLLQQQLAGKGNILPEDTENNPLTQHAIYQCGNSDWHRHVPQPSKEPVPTVSIPRPERNPKAQPALRLQRELPSESDHTDIPAEKVFADYGHVAAEYGTAIHALFEKIEWIEDADIELIITVWRETSALSETIKQEIVDGFRKACASADVRQALRRPSLQAFVLREHPFELAEDGIWVSGIVDRITVLTDKNGTPLRAEIIDYKSSRYGNREEANDLARSYVSQLQQYKKAANRLLNLAYSDIQTAILFTQSGILCPVVTAN